MIFRCDASVEIGAGHVVRCLTLAETLADSGWSCAFASNQEGVVTVPMLTRCGYDTLQLHGPAEGEPSEFAQQWPDGCDLLVVDHYQWNATFETACRPWARKILAIDDLADRPHDCELLLDQTLGRRSDEYRSLVPSACHLLLGPDYALLRPQFAAARAGALERRRAQGPLQRVLVSFGGSDPQDMTAIALEGLAATGLPVAVDIVLGTDHAEERYPSGSIGAMAAEVSVHRDVSNMAALMARADLAIGAAGTTAWERCCLGLPSIAIPVATNQERIAVELERAGAIRLLEPPGLVDHGAIAEAVLDLESNPAARAEMSARAAALCDGRGVSRVIPAIAACSALGFRIVPAPGN